MWLTLLTVTVTGVMAGDLGSQFRSPVRSYARLSDRDEQAVLIEPQPTLPPMLLHRPPLGVSQNNNNNNKGAPSNSETPSFLQDIPVNRQKFPGRRKDNSNILRLRQQMMGRTGMWRKSVGGAAEGLNIGTRRRRPGLARIRTGAALGKRRRRPVGSLTGASQFRNGPGILRNRVALQASLDELASTPKPSVDDFLSHWHSIYSRSQTKEQELTTEASVRKDPNPYTPTPLPVNPPSHGNSGNNNANKKPPQTFSQQHTNVSGAASESSVPSVHDMTSMHFTKNNNNSFSSTQATSDGKNSAVKIQLAKMPNRPAIRTRGTTRITSTSIRTTPLPAQRSDTKPKPDGKEILDSVQSIFQAARSDEHELSSLKNNNQGNTLPKPLDIFSGVPPTSGFVPSDQIQPVLGLGKDAIRSQVRESYVTVQEPTNPNLRPSTPETTNVEAEPQNFWVTSPRPYVTNAELEPQNYWVTSPKPYITDTVSQNRWVSGQTPRVSEIVPQNVWTTSEKPYFELQPNNIKPDLPPQTSSDGHFILHVGQSVPIHSEPAWNPEHRGGSEGDLILHEEIPDDVIVGRPAALIQAPPDEETVVITQPPNFQTQYGEPLQSQIHFSNPIQPQIMHFENPPQPELQFLNSTSQLQFINPSESHTHFANQVQSRTEEVPTEYAFADSSLFSQQNEELEPLVEFIKNKYDSKYIKTVPPSVTSLQSIINSGRIPEFFKRDEVLEHIQKDRVRYHSPVVNRMAKPWRNAVDKMGAHPKEKSDVGGSGQFVALSSLALVAALCGYILYSASGAAREARKVPHSLKAAVEEAKDGLHTLLQGLDEYEEHLIKEENEDKGDEKVQLPQTPMQNKSENIPIILKRIWNTVVPSEVRVSTGVVKHGTDGYKIVNASSLIRKERPREKTHSGFREPHAIQVPASHKDTGDDNFDPLINKTASSVNESVILPTVGLVSAAHSFFNSLISRKTVESVISQLVVPLASNKTTSNQATDPHPGETGTLRLRHVESTSSQNFANEPVTEEQNKANQYEPQEFGVRTTVPADLEDSETQFTEEPWQEEGFVTFSSTGSLQEGVHEAVGFHRENDKLQEGVIHKTTGEDVLHTANPPETQGDVFQGTIQEAVRTQQNTEEEVGEVTTEATTDGDLQTWTLTPPTVERRVILNNRLHVQHNPETDPPRTSAFVNNVPLKPISSDS